MMLGATSRAWLGGRDRLRVSSALVQRGSGTRHPATPRRRRATATAAAVGLATLCAPQHASAQLGVLPRFNDTGMGLFAILAGGGIAAGDAVAIDAVVRSGSCSKGPGQDGVKCGFEATGLVFVTAAAAVGVGGGIALIVIDQRTPPAARRVAAPSLLLAPERPPALELHATPRGLVLRGVF
jgi:hypothetical protein